MAELKMLDEIVRVPFEKLDEMNGNPRKMTAQDREDLEQSIKEFGLVDPLVVWAGIYPSKPRKVWKVIGGHQRLSVLKELAEKYGIETVPVLPWFGSEAKALKLNLVLNRVGADWDYVLLKDWFAKIEEIEGEDNLGLTGFTVEEIDFVRQAEEGALVNLATPDVVQLSMLKFPEPGQEQPENLWDPESADEFLESLSEEERTIIEQLLQDAKMEGLEERPDFQDLIDEFDLGERGQAKGDENWFYVEYYGDDERMAEMVSRLKPYFKGQSKHELEGDWFHGLITEHVPVHEGDVGGEPEEATEG